MGLMNLFRNGNYTKTSIGDDLVSSMTSTPFGTLDIISDPRHHNKIVSHVDKHFTDMVDAVSTFNFNRSITITVDATDITDNQIIFLNSTAIPTHAVFASSIGDDVVASIWDIDSVVHELSHVYHKQHGMDNQLPIIQDVRELITEPLKTSLSFRHKKFDNWDWYMSDGPGHYDSMRNYHLSDEELYARMTNLCYAQSNPRL